MSNRQAKAPTDFDRAIARKIRLARRELRLTQEKLGDALGMTFQQVQKYEAGVNRVSSGVLFEISNVLNKPVSWFFSDLELRPARPRNPKTTDTVAGDCIELIDQLAGDPILKAVREILLNAKNAKQVAA